MKTLVFQSEDPSTIFLAPIYGPIKYKTVIEGGISKTELRTLIEEHCQAGNKNVQRTVNFKPLNAAYRRFLEIGSLSLFIPL